MRSGILFGVSSYVLWGLTPIFWKLLSEVPARQQVALRIMFALPVVLIVMRFRGKSLPRLKARTVAVLVLGSVFLFANWWMFVWAISVDRIVDTSLAYYISPLVSVLFGVVLLGERMRRLQCIAVGLATIGVVYLTIRLGVVPWLSLAMAGSFGLYGLFKKITPEADAFHGLAIETSWLAVGSLGMIIWWNLQDVAVFPAVDISSNLLMVLTGVVTVIPLWFFGRAAHLIPLSTLGGLQYLTPTISLLVGVFLYGEQLVGDRLIGFMLVWAALAVFAYDSVGELKAVS
jgi:chloramphenicol-sensitive protein RarD